jgi:hypothetical protein
MRHLFYQLKLSNYFRQKLWNEQTNFQRFDILTVFTVSPLGNWGISISALFSVNFPAGLRNWLRVCCATIETEI